MRWFAVQKYICEKLFNIYQYDCQKESFVLILVTLDISEVKYLLISIGYFYSHFRTLPISKFCPFALCQNLYIVHLVIMEKINLCKLVYQGLNFLLWLLQKKKSHIFLSWHVWYVSCVCLYECFAYIFIIYFLYDFTFKNVVYDETFKISNQFYSMHSFILKVYIMWYLKLAKYLNAI